MVQAAQDPQEHASTVVRPAIERPSVGARRRVEKVPKAQGSLVPNRSMWQDSRTPTTKLETKKNNRRPKWECLSWVHSPRESPRKTQAGFGSTLIRAAQTGTVDWKDRIPTKEGAQMMFKTASGELVPGTGTGTFQGKSETGSRCRVAGPLAPVHKPLVSAYKCLKHGRMAVLDQDGGQLIPVDSATGRKIQQLLNKPSKAQKSTWLPIVKTL